MDNSNVNKKNRVVGFIMGIILGCAMMEGVEGVVTNEFSEATKVFMLVTAIIFILFHLFTYLKNLQGRTIKKTSLALGMIALCVALVIFFLLERNFFVNETWSVLAPVSGIVLLFAGGALSVSSYFSILDENHRNQGGNDKA